MIPRSWSDPLAKPTAIAIAVVLLVAGVWIARERYLQSQISQFEIQANIAKGEFNALKAQYKAKDVEAATATKAVEDSDKVANTLRARLAKAKADLDAANGSQREHTTVVQLPDPSINTPIVVDDLKDKVIEAMDAQIKTRDALIGSLRQTITLRDLAIDAKDRENLNLRASNAAKDGLIKGALLKGRIQGLAVGLGSGYLYGRMR